MLATRNKFFTPKGMRHWYKLHRAAVSPSFLEAFVARLGGVLASLSWWEATRQGTGTGWTLRSQTVL